MAFCQCARVAGGSTHFFGWIGRSNALAALLLISSNKRGRIATLRAIETEYQGCRFRSRAEARWAASPRHFADPVDLRTRWLNLDGKLYLPDFWVQCWDAWLKVKASKPLHADADKCRTVEMFVRHGRPSRLPGIGARDKRRPRSLLHRQAAPIVRWSER